MIVVKYPDEFVDYTPHRETLVEYLCEDEAKKEMQEIFDLVKQEDGIEGLGILLSGITAYKVSSIMRIGVSTKIDFLEA